MNELLLIGAALAVLLAPATAAEKPVQVYKRPRPVVMAAPIYTWTGFYTGGVVGGSSGKFDVNNSVVGSGPAVAAINAVGAQSITRANAALGLQAGYNWQFGRFVAGIETDIEFIGLSGGALTNSIFPGPTPFTWSSNTSTNWLKWTRKFGPVD